MAIPGEQNAVDAIKIRTRSGKMKIRKSTIVWFVLAVLIAASQIFSAENHDEVYWSDAVFIEGAKVMPENDGKLVAVSGKAVML